MIKSYETMPVGVYQRLMEVAQENDEVSRNIATLSVLSGIPEANILTAPITEVQSLMGELGFLLEQPKPAKVQKEYKVGEWVLRPTLKQTKMTTAQYIDFQEFTKGGEDKYLVELCSVLLVPVGHKYNDDTYDLDELHDAIREHLPITDAVALLAFFLTSCEKSIARTLNYLVGAMWLHKKVNRKEAEKMAEAITAVRRLKTLVGSGDGWRWSTALLKLPALLGRGYMPLQ